MTNSLNWLTLEEAAAAISVDPKTLTSFLEDSMPEKCFQPHGLLFDPDRWHTGQPFLQLLDLTPASKAECDRAMPTSSDRTYRWDDMPIRLEILWLPTEPNTGERKVLIAATSYDDFPVSNLIDEPELGELQFVLEQLLDELRRDLPIRKIRYQKKTSTKSKSTANQSSAPRAVSQSPSPIQATLPESNSLTQISLF